MKCFNHVGLDAVAHCSFCGKGVCPECARPSASRRLVCSTECSEAISASERTIKTLFQQGRRNAQASAMYCFLGAVLSGGGAIVAWYMLPSPFLILFVGGCALVLLLSGIWYMRAAGK